MSTNLNFWKYKERAAHNNKKIMKRDIEKSSGNESLCQYSILHGEKIWYCK